MRRSTGTRAAGSRTPQKIHVPEGAPVVTAVPADRAALKPGEHVFFAADHAADGKMTASGRIQVSKDGVRPPM